MTLPVVLHCGTADLGYDGYYVPNGNSFTWPVGPNLTITPGAYVAAGSECSVSIKADAVKDKSGTAVPAGDLGPFTFKIAPMAFLGTDPPAAAEPPEVALGSVVTFIFNAPIDIASVTPDDFTVLQGTTPVPATVALNADAQTNVEVTVAGGFLAGQTYTITMNTGAEVADIGGATYAITAADNATVTVKIAATMPMP